VREFSLNIQEAFRKGLRADESNPVNNEALVECYNAKPSPMGLVPFVPITDPFTGATVDWPFPQLFIGRDYRIYCTATQVFQLSTWAFGSAKATVTEDSRWDFIDFGSYFILVNGNKIITIDPDDGSYTSSSSLTNIPRFSTGCAFRGRIIGGNIKSTWHGCDTCSVVWSKVGEANFTPDKSNLAGFRPMFWEGGIHKVLPLGKAVAVYGDNGISLLFPVIEPATTFGEKRITNIGIPTKGAIDGDENEHVFVDNENYLWRWQDGKLPERLGYQEFMEDLTTSELVVSKGLNNEYYISDSSTCYLLTPYGLCEVYQLPTTVAVTDGTAYGVFTDTEDYEFRVKVDTLDFGVRGFKTLTSMEVGLYNPSTVGETTILGYGSTEYRNSKTAAFAQTGKGWIEINGNGVVVPYVTANEFRPQVKATRFENVKLDYMRVHVKYSDHRSHKSLEIRGGNASPLIA